MADPLAKSSPMFGPTRTTSRGAPRPTAAAPPPAPGTKEKQSSGPPGKEVVHYSWAHSNMRYLPNEAAKEAEDAIKAAREEAKHWADSAKDWELRHDDEERKRKEAEVECMRKVHEVTWLGVKRETEYEDRVRLLENQIDEEREAHEKALKKHEDLARQATEEAETLRRDSEKHYMQMIAAADARAKDAEERAEMVLRRSEEEVAATKVAAEKRVQEIRKWADARVKECDDQKEFEVGQMHAKTVQRQRQMEETLYLNGRQKSTALEDAKRHTAAVEQDCTQWKAIQEIEFARKDARLDEWISKQRRQNDTLEKHHKGMLDLEVGLHNRTMERTMQRVNRQLEYGDGATAGRETPTRHVLRDIPSSPPSGSQMPAITSGSPLANVGGTLVSSGI